MGLKASTREAHHDAAACGKEMSRPVGRLTRELLDRFWHMRARTLMHVAALQNEDSVVQSIPQANRENWHLAHATPRGMSSNLRLARDLTRSTSRQSVLDGFASDVVTGLSAIPKTLPSKYFYDETGSVLFEAICDTPEYYVTRAETALLEEIAPQLAGRMPANTVLVEFGSGASHKTRVLLDAAPQITAYVPIDISPSALQSAVVQVTHDYPAVGVWPLFSDFTCAVNLPPEVSDYPRVGFFPGSTIGNFMPGEAVSFLQLARDLLGSRSRLIVGVDMIKDPTVLLAAYDDSEGVTARFNKNVLARINREIEGDFDLEQFDHLAYWNSDLSRIEMHLVSRIDQLVHVDGHEFAFKSGEHIHTENSHKYSIEFFTALARSAGWEVDQCWVSAAPEFALFSLIQRY